MCTILAMRCVISNKNKIMEIREKSRNKTHSCRHTLKYTRVKFANENSSLQRIVKYIHISTWFVLYYSTKKEFHQLLYFAIILRFLGKSIWYYFHTLIEKFIPKVWSDFVSRFIFRIYIHMLKNVILLLTQTGKKI